MIQATIATANEMYETTICDGSDSSGHIVSPATITNALTDSKMCGLCFRMKQHLSRNDNLDVIHEYISIAIVINEIKPKNILIVVLAVLQIYATRIHAHAKIPSELRPIL